MSDGFISNSNSLGGDVVDEKTRALNVKAPRTETTNVKTHKYINLVIIMSEFLISRLNLK